ncbi:MAG TPA: CDP-diacylglycerol--glycerol-3-phosphate 3-phosphatidyltransferase [Ignavibacteria bacterium]|nr:CDP-diacylglycerol--glycerol-3-phosphate 3-phosphatidyltransferase [Ignavibacteria bacterium]HQY52260.1 CDP-diacylglycerol--glycerol-3-phosphate 3-phosphatidyltransferase [Ignavibacteria bacterium]HRB01065.1 CDP-diacylglycerol--glycerol-3-phosphate 3-phosphatidyltransferase [Ignavibacteria bacterium]
MSLPNQLSILRILLAPLFLFLFLSEDQLYKELSIVVFLLAVFTDWYDGWHARKFGLVSKLGIFIDPLADKILTSAAFIGFYFMGFMPIWMVLITVVRDLIITILRSYHEIKGITMKTSFIAKTKTFIQMTYIFSIVLLIGIQTYSENIEVKNSINDFLFSNVNYLLMLLVTLLTLITGITYFFEKNNAVNSLNEIS